MVIFSIDPATHPPIRESTAMTSKIKQGTKTKELEELQDKLDEPYKLDELECSSRVFI